MRLIMPTGGFELRSSVMWGILFYADYIAQSDWEKDKLPYARDPHTGDTSRCRETVDGDLYRLPPDLSVRKNYNTGYLDWYYKSQRIGDGTMIAKSGFFREYIYVTNSRLTASVCEFCYRAGVVDYQNTKYLLFVGPRYRLFRDRYATGRDTMWYHQQSDCCLFLLSVSPPMRALGCYMSVPKTGPYEDPLQFAKDWSVIALNRYKSQRWSGLAGSFRATGICYPADFSSVIASINAYARNANPYNRYLDEGARDNGLRGVLFQVYNPTIRDLKPVKEALADLAYDINANSSGTDLNTTMLIKEIVELIHNPRSIMRLGNGSDLRRLSNAFLSWKYGARLTYADSRKLIEDLVKAYRNSGICADFLRASRTVHADGMKQRYTLKMYLSPFNSGIVDSLLGALADWHLVPSLVDLWDYVPYSFVIDWFVNISKALEFVEVRSLWMRYDILSCTYGISLSYPVDLPESVVSGFTGSLTYHYYDRWFQKDLRLPLFPPLGGSGGLRNIPEAVALIVQRGK